MPLGRIDDFNRGTAQGMVVSRNPEEGAKVKRRSPQQVLDDIVSAAYAEFKENGYERTTTAAIGRKANVSESQIYRYFATKLDLFHASVFHLVERDITDFYEKSEMLLASGKYVGTINELGEQRVAETLDFLKKNSDALLTLMFARTYVPDAKGLGDIPAMANFFERSTEAVFKHRRPKGVRGTIDPNLLLRSLFLSALANAVFRDIVFPPGIATDEEIDEAVTIGIIEGMSAFLI
jgi:AcrR family transcriptional regulator